MKKGDDVELVIETLSGDGSTVARKEGMVYFVTGAVPGDTVRAKLWRIKKNYAEARTVEVLSPSPLRTTPPCRHFGTCGGCRLQDFAYDAQLDAKRRLVSDAFLRIGNFPNPDVAPVIGCAEPYWYRNKMEYTFSNLRWLTADEIAHKEEIPKELALGLHVPERYDKVLNLDECFLQPEPSAAILKTVREIFRVWGISAYSTLTHTGYARHLVIRNSVKTNGLMVNLVTTNDWPEAMEKLTGLLLKQFPEITTIVNNITERKSMVAFGDKEKVYHGPGTITEQLGDFSFTVSANSFFQTNTLQAERLYEQVKEFAALSPSDVVYDLYSGTGTIAIYLARSAERVIGLEMVASSVADAEKNAAANHIPNCYFLQGDLKDSLTINSSWLSEHPKPTVLVADPPRSGMHPKVIERIAKLRPARIIYVSCNPSTQARDARLLCDSGYRLGKIQPVDMFPHTDHIEAVALLEAE
jgi:23S rRNA (uracil1939-C5)-methyltransferase